MLNNFKAPPRSNILPPRPGTVPGANGVDIPRPPRFQNQTTYVDGRRTSHSYKKGNEIINKTYSSPEEKAIKASSLGGINNIMGNLPQLTPEAISGYGEAFANPQIRALNDSYNLARGQGSMAAAGSGALNSVGFGRYMSNELEKNRAQGLADIAANRHLMELDLPNKVLSPHVNKFNLLNAALTGQQAQTNQNQQFGLQNQVFGSNAANQAYQNQLNFYQMQQQANQPQRGGMFSFFTGGA